LGTGIAEEFSALADDRRGDVYTLQGKRADAKAEYQKAFKAFDEQSEYRRLVVVKLNALGVDPLSDTKTTTNAEGSK